MLSAMYYVTNKFNGTKDYAIDFITNFLAYCYPKNYKNL